MRSWRCSAMITHWPVLRSYRKCEGAGSRSGRWPTIRHRRRDRARATRRTTGPGRRPKSTASAPSTVLLAQDRTADTNWVRGEVSSTSCGKPTSVTGHQLRGGRRRRVPAVPRQPLADVFAFLEVEQVAELGSSRCGPALAIRARKPSIGSRRRARIPRRGSPGRGPPRRSGYRARRGSEPVGKAARERRRAGTAAAPQRTRRSAPTGRNRPAAGRSASRGAGRPGRRRGCRSARRRVRPTWTP